MPASTGNVALDSQGKIIVYKRVCVTIKQHKTKRAALLHGGYFDRRKKFTGFFYNPAC